MNILEIAFISTKQQYKTVYKKESTQSLNKYRVCLQSQIFDEMSMGTSMHANNKLASAQVQLTQNMQLIKSFSL